jgi:hypothetical protein
MAARANEIRCWTRRYDCVAQATARKILTGTAAQRCVELQQQQISTARRNKKSHRRQRPAAARYFATLGG